MAAPARLVGFVLLALALFLGAALFAPRAAYGVCFRGAANLMFRAVPTDLTAKLNPVTDERGIHDTRLNVGRRSRGLGGGINLDSIRQGYLPTALLVSLVLATPVAWKRRWRSLAIGLAVLHAFLALRLWVTALTGFAVMIQDGRRLLELSPFSMEVLGLLDELLSGDLHVTYVAPVLIWLVVTVRPEDLDSLRPQPRRSRTAARPRKRAG